MKNTGSYTGGIDYQGNIYVHLHARNIGRAEKGKRQNGASLVKLFNDSKQKAFEASKRDYKKLFFNSLSSQSQELLNQILNNQDSFRKVQQQIGKQLQSYLSVESIEKLIDIQKNSNSFKMIENIFKRNQSAISSFNSLLNSMAQAAKILGTQQGAALAVVLSDQAKTTNFSINQKGENLQKALLNFQQNNNKKRISGIELDQVNHIIGTINAFANNVQNFSTATGKGLTEKGLRTTFNNIFSTGFGQALAAKVSQIGKKHIAQELIKLTGAKTTNIQMLDIEGNILQGLQNRSAAGKADLTMSDVKFSIEELEQQISLNLGISNKLYRSYGFNNLSSNQMSGSYSSGSGGSLEEALYSSFSSGRLIYLAYNTIGHGKDNSEYSLAQQALHQVILTRQIVRLFSARGGNEDFSQFLFVNGQIIPIYEIIMSTLQNISKSQSQTGSEGQPLYLHIQNRQAIQHETHQAEKKNLKRISDVNQAFRKAKISAHVNIQNLIKINGGLANI